jgi:ubiquinone/menaquinone biosynthesis C-methylase UbiE
MGQKENIIYNILSSPFIYSSFQKLMKGDKIRKKILTNVIKKNNPHILDIGCGLGDSLDYINNAVYYGYDISKRYINHAKKKYKTKGNFICRNFTKKEIKKLPKFDYTLLIGILHHLTNKQIINLLKLIKIVLKKDGKIITLDPIYKDKQNFFAKFLISHDRGMNIKTKKKYLKLVGDLFKYKKCKTYNQSFIPYTWFTMTCNN